MSRNVNNEAELKHNGRLEWKTFLWIIQLYHDTHSKMMWYFKATKFAASPRNCENREQNIFLCITVHNFMSIDFRAAYMSSCLQKKWSTYCAIAPLLLLPTQYFPQNLDMSVVLPALPMKRRPGSPQRIFFRKLIKGYFFQLFGQVSLDVFFRMINY